MGQNEVWASEPKFHAYVLYLNRVSCSVSPFIDAPVIPTTAPIIMKIIPIGSSCSENRYWSKMFWSTREFTASCSLPTRPEYFVSILMQLWPQILGTSTRCTTKVCLQKMGYFAEAIKYYDKALLLTPNDKDTLLKKAKLCMRWAIFRWGY